jgi:hypothetical protein
MEAKRKMVGVSTVINLSIPALELGHADTMLCGNGAALVAGGDLVETITDVYNPRHRGGIARRGFGGGGWRRCRRECGTRRRGIISEGVNYAV